MPSFPPGFTTLGQYALLRRNPGPKDRTHVRIKVAGTSRTKPRLILADTSYSGSLVGWNSLNGDIEVENFKDTLAVRILYKVVTVTGSGTSTITDGDPVYLNDHTFPMDTIPSPITYPYSYIDQVVVTVAP